MKIEKKLYVVFYRSRFLQANLFMSRNLQLKLITNKERQISKREKLSVFKNSVTTHNVTAHKIIYGC
jgi:hypothetical protein